jgi:hypothetical protein
MPTLWEPQTVQQTLRREPHYAALFTGVYHTPLPQCGTYKLLPSRSTGQPLDCTLEYQQVGDTPLNMHPYRHLHY